MALSPDFRNFRNMVLKYVETGEFPEDYPNLNFFKEYAECMTEHDLYRVKSICEKKLEEQAKQLEESGGFRYKLGLLIFSNPITECKNRLNLIIPQELSKELKAEYDQEEIKENYALYLQERRKSRKSRKQP